MSPIVGITLKSRALVRRGMKMKCETFGCTNLGFKIYHLGPATVVWLCAPCIQVAERDKTA